MTKEVLDAKVAEVKNETKIALETMYNALNQGQQKQIIKDKAVLALFERYGVEYQRWNMIKREFYKTRNDGVNLYRSYSDINHYIKQNETGVIYTEAVDVEDAPYTYSETEISISDDDFSSEATVENN